MSKTSKRGRRKNSALSDIGNSTATKTLSQNLENPPSITTIEFQYVNVHQFYQPYKPSEGEIVVCFRVGWFEYDPDHYTDIDCIGIYLGDGRVLIEGEYQIRNLTEKSRKLITENMNVSRMLQKIKFS